MERRIGEEFQFDNVRLKAVKAPVDKYGEGLCKGCYFENHQMIACGNHLKEIGECDHMRDDKTPVIFKKVNISEQSTAEKTIADEPKSFKNDRIDGKPRWELLPLPDLEDIVKVYAFGAEKYEVDSWRGLEDGFDRYKAALLRHLVSFERGEEFDEESGLPALAHLAWNAIAMLAIWHDEQNEKIEIKQKNQ